MDFIKDFYGFLSERKKWWLTPILLILLIIGALIVFSSGTAISPFIYTIF